MPIISSSFTVDSMPQADGRRWVKETHIDHNSKTYNIEYLASDGFDYATCMNLRAQNIGKEIDSKEASATEAANFVLPITKLQFLQRMTMQERILCKEFAKTDPIAQDFLFLLDLAEDVVLGNQSLLEGLSYMESLGVLNAGRALEIGSDI